MNKRILLIVALSVLLASCRGREARPVAIHEPGDEQKTCAALMTEMTMIEGRVSKLGGQDRDKNTSNAIWGVTGIFLYVPLIMLDLSDAEKIEMQAYQDRYRTLAVIAVNKGCDPQRSAAYAPRASVASPATASPAPVYTAPPVVTAPPVQSPATLPPITDMPEYQASPPAAQLPAARYQPGNR